MRRRQDWPQRLAAFLAHQHRVPFAWGTADCITLVADAIEAMTGVDPIADIRGTWTDQATAFLAISQLGTGLAEAIDAVLLPLGSQRIERSMVGRGDIVTIKQPLGVAAGIFAGAGIACRGKAGFAWFARADIVAAWRI